MASKKDLLAAAKAAEEAVLCADAAVETAKSALRDAEERRAIVVRRVSAAKLVLAQSAPLSKTALAFLQAAASEGGHSYNSRRPIWRSKGGDKTADGITAEKLEALAFVEIRHGRFDGAVATATDAGRAKLAEYAEALAKKGGM